MANSYRGCTSISYAVRACEYAASTDTPASVCTRESTTRRKWTLGVGPCGKDVYLLYYKLDDGALFIEQHTTCGERLEFIIPLHTIVTAITIDRGLRNEGLR